MKTIKATAPLLIAMTSCEITSSSMKCGIKRGMYIINFERNYIENLGNLTNMNNYSKSSTTINFLQSKKTLLHR